jgi:hypothetical protein
MLQLPKSHNVRAWDAPNPEAIGGKKFFASRIDAAGGAGRLRRETVGAEKRPVQNRPEVLRMGGVEDDAVVADDGLDGSEDVDKSILGKILDRYSETDHPPADLALQATIDPVA